MKKKITRVIEPLENLISSYQFSKYYYDENRKLYSNLWKERGFNQLKIIFANETLTNVVDGSLHDLYNLFLYSYYVKKDVLEAKQHCYTIAKLIQAFYHYFGNMANDSKIYRLEHYLSNSLALLSDNHVVKEFQHYDYTMRNMYGNNTRENRDYFLTKQGFIFGYVMQCIVNKDLNKLDYCIDSGHKLKSKTEFKSRHYELHLKVWEAVRDFNSDGLEDSLNLLIKKTHKTFHSGHLWGEFLSAPATGYLKAAWIIGLEVEVKNKLIPMELMPVKPLISYKNDFDFFFK